MMFKEMSKKQFLNFVEELEPDKITYISPKDFPDYTEGKFSEEIQVIAFKRKDNETGAIVMDDEFLVVPPIPISKTFSSDLSYLKELLDKKYTFGIILLRLGNYALGVFDSGELKTHKSGSRYVKGQAKAGGQSAARFERIRDEQIHHLFKEVCNYVQEKFEPYKNKIDYVFLGGDSKVNKDFVKSCQYLEQFNIMDRTLDARHMKHSVLKNILKEVWKFRVFQV